MAGFDIHLLPSDKGDCLLVDTDKSLILVDGGMYDSYETHVRPFLADLFKTTGRALDLVYVSHIDQDHIAGVLTLLDDTADWRVFDHKTANNLPAKAPAAGRPPPVKRLWHNAFRDMVGANAGAIESLLAARAVSLATGGPASLALAEHYQGIAASIPEAIKVSRRAAPAQLNIPLNKEFGGKLAMVRPAQKKVRLRSGGKLTIGVIGPFKEDLDRLRGEWNAWLDNPVKQAKLRSTRAEADEEDERLDFGEIVAAIDDEIGKRSVVTAPNLASLMLVFEKGTRQLILTGDGHSRDVVKGLEHYGLLKPGSGVHVDVLKVPHHGSEHNLDRDFVKRVTADHYIFCANGMHQNPDLRIVRVLLDSRLGTAEQRSANAEVGRPFHVWLNCSSRFLGGEIARLKRQKKQVSEYEHAREHLTKVEEMLDKAAAASPALKVHYLDAGSLTLRL